MKVVIFFYTAEPKPLESYSLNSAKDLEAYNYRLADLLKHKAKFAVYIVSECVGDFS